MPFILIILFLLLWAIFKLNIPSMRGSIGEKRVNASAKRWLDPDTYELFHDVTIPTKAGKTTQIDHVILSEFGIFVIETKNYSGWIFGSSEQRQWTQVVYHEKNRFQNPLRQNYGHICGLSELLGVPKSKFHNVVCFVGDAEFKTEMPRGVFYDSDYIGYIESCIMPLLTKQEVARIGNRLERTRLEQGAKTTRLHVQNLRNQSNDETLVCSRCGKPMVLRTARKGERAGENFWGCSGFPKCRNIVPSC